MISVSNERFVACLDCAAALALAAFVASLAYAFSDDAYRLLSDAFHQTQSALAALAR